MSSDGDIQSEGIASGLEELYGADDSDYDEEELEQQQYSQEEDIEEEEEDESLEDEEEQDEQFEQVNELNELLRKLDGQQSGVDFKKLQYLAKGMDRNKERKQCEKLLQKIDQNQEYDEQKQELLKNDEEELGKLLKDLQKSVLENNNSYLGQYKVLRKKKGLEVSQGIGFLNAKSLVFQEYLINLHFYLLQKLQGQEIDMELVKKLLYQKTLLQKMKPVEKKLDYQIQKLIKFSQKKPQNNDNNKVFNPHADSDESDQEQQKNQKQQQQDEEQDQEDPLNYKPNIGNFGDSSDDDQEQDKPKKYVAPKLVSALSKDDKLAETQRRQEERRKTYLRRQLVDSFGDDGINQREVKNLQHSRRIVDKQDLERERWEMDNFQRLPTTKKDKQKERKIQKTLQVGGERLDDFSEERKIRELLSYEKIIDKKDNPNYGNNNSNLKKRKFNNNGFGGGKSNNKGKGGFKGQKKFKK